MPIRETFFITSSRVAILMSPERAILRGCLTKCLPSVWGLATSYDKTEVDGYGIMNLRLGVGGENWRVTAFARNLLDEEFIAEVILAPEFGGGFVTPGAYRSAGVELEFMF